MDRQGEIEEAIAALGADTGFAAFARGDAALLVWSVDGDRLVWTSPAARPFRQAIAGQDGKVRAGFPARSRLRALGQGLAPATGVRLERLRFDAGGLSVPVTCACRRLSLSSGEEVLLTAIAGAVPKVGAAIPPVDIVDVSGAAPPEDEERDPLARLHGRGTVRFLWQTDASGRFIAHSESLAEVVGEAGAAVTGRSWPDIAGDLVRDPTGRIADAFARRETWSGETVHWRIAGTDHAVAVDLAGMPVFDRARHFTGFRGFGLCRTDVLSEWLSSSPAEPSPQEPPEAGVAPTPAEAAGYATAVPHGLAAPTEPVASSAGAPHGPVAPSPPLSDETAASPPVASSAGAPHGPVAPGPSVSEETAASPPVASSAGALHGPVAPSPSLSGETAASPPAAAAPARMPVLLPERAAASDTASQTVGEAVMGAATARSVVPITGLRTHVAAHLGAAPVPLRPREEAGAARAEAVRPANDDGELAGSVQPAEPKRLPLLSSEERSAFREIARSLGARFDDEAAEAQLPASEMSNDARVRELAAILDTATDGVIILNDGGRIVSLNRSAEALFGYEQSDVAGESLAVLLAPESQAVTGGYLEGLRDSGVAMLLNDGREVLGRVRQGGVIPLFMTIGRLSEEPGRKFCVVLRDMTAVKTAEAELLAAKRVAQEASAYKSDFLTRLGDEVKSPLNAIIGFAELMREERFGPLGNERYRDAVKDIHACARHIGKILDGLLDLAKIEAGCMELSFTGVNLNDLVANCLAEMLQQAARERIVIRTSFAPKMPAVVADERSLRQVVLNIVSNAVKFTNAGGQVIISTAMTDRGEVALRVRDTGVGMTDDEIRTALEPLHQPAQGHGGSGLGLALAKALIEANRGALHITSTPHEGTLVEVLFPPTRVLAE